MSAICVFTPVVVDLAWPVASAAIASALVSLGYSASQTAAADTAQGARTTVELEVKRAQGFAESLGTDEQVTARRGGVVLVFRKGADGKLKVCASGEGLSEDELRAAGTEAMNAFLQTYVREKVAAELKKRGFALQEERLEDGTIRLQARKWG